MPDWGLCDQHCQVGLDKYVICFHRTLILHSNSKSSEADNKHGQICLTLYAVYKPVYLYLTKFKSWKIVDYFNSALRIPRNDHIFCAKFT